MTETQKKIQQLRERNTRRSMARFMAGEITATKSAKSERELRLAVGILGACILAHLDNPAKFLREVADSLDGNLHGARYDEAIKQAEWAALKTGRRKAERSNPFRPLFSEVDDALTIVLTEMGYKDRPTKDGLRRRLKILGRRLSKKQGRHRKKICHGPESLRNRGKRLH